MRQIAVQPRFDQGLLVAVAASKTACARASVADVPVADVRVADVRVADVPVADVFSAEVSCAEVAVALPSILDGGSAADEAVVQHVGSCLRCQSELARYRKLLRLLNQLRAHRVEPPPGAVTDVLGALEDAAQRRVIRSALTGRRLAYAGAFAAPAVAIVAVTAARRGRLRRVRPVVLS